MDYFTGAHLPPNYVLNLVKRFKMGAFLAGIFHSNPVFVVLCWGLCYDYSGQKNQSTGSAWEMRGGKGKQRDLNLCGERYAVPEEG